MAGISIVSPWSGILQFAMLVQLTITALVGLVGLVLYTLWSFSTPALNAEFGCHCGQVQGKVTASSILHVVCYCDDCQALDTRLRVKYPKLATGLNECGGTRAVMVFPSEVTIRQAHRGQAERTHDHAASLCVVLRLSLDQRRYARDSIHGDPRVGIPGQTCRLGHSASAFLHKVCNWRRAARV
ncbi:hypothetical protein AC1031_016706 [Aphanomyces cochlioides]|nr:hypothetical protein AC1031_016706 [Aphanomyces cochlioides]